MSCIVVTIIIIIIITITSFLLSKTTSLENSHICQSQHNTTQNALPSPPANATESPSPQKLLQPHTATTPHHSSLVIRIVPNPHAPHHNQLSSFRHGTYTCLSYNTIRGTCFAIRTEILLHQSHLRETSH